MRIWIRSLRIKAMCFDNSNFFNRGAMYPEQGFGRRAHLGALAWLALALIHWHVCGELECLQWCVKMCFLNNSFEQQNWISDCFSWKFFDCCNVLSVYSRHRNLIVVKLFITECANRLTKCSSILPSPSMGQGGKFSLSSSMLSYTVLIRTWDVSLRSPEFIDRVQATLCLLSTLDFAWRFNDGFWLLGKETKSHLLQGFPFLFASNLLYCQEQTLATLV